MSRYSGPQGPGGARAAREQRRAEADERNSHTKPSRTRRVRREGCPSGKAGYDSEHAARAELVGCLVARNRGKDKRQERRVYECPQCGAWHLTSKEGRSA